MNPESIKNLIENTVKNMLNSYINFTVPQHTHNGTDSLRFPIQNLLIIAGVGIPLVNGLNQYNLYIDSGDSSLELLPNPAVYAAELADFNIGEIGTPFNNVNIATDTGIQFSVKDKSPGLGVNVITYGATVTNDAISDGINSATEQFTPNIKRFTSNDPTFQITINNTNYVPTSKNATTGSTIASGTVDLTINGTVYNVLVT